MSEPSPGSEAHVARAAAEQAEESTQWDVAAERYETALSLIPGTSMAADEGDLLTALGRCYWNLSDARMAWRTLRRAIALYRDGGDGIGMARATLEILRIWGPPDRQKSMAEEALEALGDRDAHLRAMLLLRARREGEALALAREHGLDDVLIIETEREAYVAYDEGRVGDANAALRRAHELHARLRNYHGAAGVLRYAGFETMAMGFLDDGEQLSSETVAYTRSVHLRFTEQLALMDLVGVAFARCDFERCETLIAQRPAETDFRGDLYRMWTAELRGDMAAALALMVDPELGGGATTALAQTHAAAAGLLHHAGRDDAARQELEVWASIAREGQSFCDEAPALADCLIALGSDALVSQIHDQFENRKAPVVYSTCKAGERPMCAVPSPSGSATSTALAICSARGSPGPIASAARSTPAAAYKDWHRRRLPSATAPPRVHTLIAQQRSSNTIRRRCISISSLLSEGARGCLARPLP